MRHARDLGKLSPSTQDAAAARLPFSVSQRALAEAGLSIEQLCKRAGVALDAKQFPAALFADLYHQRWRIEEASKRLKHRLHARAIAIDRMRLA